MKNKDHEEVMGVKVSCAFCNKTLVLLTDDELNFQGILRIKNLKNYHDCDDMGKMNKKSSFFKRLSNFIGRK